MAQQLSTRIVDRYVPSLRQLKRFTLLVLLVLFAVWSTQWLPGASAQESDAPASAPEEDKDRRMAVSSDQAMPSDRSLQVPAIGGVRPDNDGLTGAIQVPSRSTRPSPPPQLSAPGQDAGQLSLQRLEGSDACDEEQGLQSPDICSKTLESRAGEFPGRTRPQLSAEQRLLAQQYTVPTSVDATDGAARRLAAGRNAELTNDDLAIAAVASAGQGASLPPQDDAESQIPAEATDAIDAILGVVNAQPPR
ncbi:MAG: hypothetical protein ACT6Q7_16405 [Blastomonas fulva]|jgi:hypothetical protein|uniref:hypothetical protein n=1 Tax=Blastomonas fulva TaxID=1550728 RepID=UPI0040337763